MARQREFDKDQVVERAMLLFWEQGYEATSMRDLLETMGISSSSLYTVFADKRGVYLAALEQFCEQERARIALMAQEEPSPERFIERLFGPIDQAVQPTLQAQGSLAFNAMIEFGTRDPDITQLLLSHYFGIAQIVAAVIQQGQEGGVIKTGRDPQELAYAILSTLHGVATMKGVKPDFPHAAITRLVLELLHV
ncbi:MAG: TetR/AcrR family transcriptional regulator [Chloroflexi bacterium]|nr:TetR/AcrR family transcriptional regulator [Chloroflexota bacterium]